MINSLEARYFRKHEDLKLDFTSGLNVLRGSNEAGKTTITEIILYCYFGAAALIDTLAEVVTWGHKENELKAKTVSTISGITYIFSRSKSGAECNYVTPEGQTVRVTGQKEVTAFAGALLGADAKTASVLMLSSQAGLRGALDEGATAVGALMGKLADFDTIDTLLQNATASLALGSIVPVQEKLAAADLDVLAAQGDLADPAVLNMFDANITIQSAMHAAAVAKTSELLDVLAKADLARDEAVAANAAADRAQRQHEEISAKLEVEEGRLIKARADALVRPAPEALAAARAAVTDAATHVERSKLYAQFLALPAYPDVAWDDTKETFDVALAEAAEKFNNTILTVREIVASIAAEKRNLLVPGAACRACGHKSDDPSHMTEHNAAVDARVLALEGQHYAANVAWNAAKGDYEDLVGVQKVAQALHAKYDQIRDHLAYDVSCYPAKVTWNGSVPDTAPNVAALRATVDSFESQERLATQAEGRVKAHETAIEEHKNARFKASRAVYESKPVALDPLNAAYQAAATAHGEQSTVTSTLGYALDDLKATRANLARVAEDAQRRLMVSQARVAEYVADIKVLEFNNELVRKLKSMKPQVTDFLWSKVLGAVSNYFSMLRGEQSVVTKDATGFRVNGRGGSLSGSTLDVLALSIRVALTKTFVPWSNFLVLDEPAHGADQVRTGNILGFLAGIGFDQVILASHDPFSESVAQNVITLGVA